VVSEEEGGGELAGVGKETWQGPLFPWVHRADPPRPPTLPGPPRTGRREGRSQAEA